MDAQLRDASSPWREVSDGGRGGGEGGSTSDQGQSEHESIGDDYSLGRIYDDIASDTDHARTGHRRASVGSDSDLADQEKQREDSRIEEERDSVDGEASVSCRRKEHGQVATCENGSSRELEVAESSSRGEERHKQTPTALDPSSQVVRTHIQDQSIYVYRFPLPCPRLIAHLVGRRGAHVQSVRDEAGVDIHYSDRTSVSTSIFGETSAEGVPPLGYIQGAIPNIRHALRAISELLRSIRHPWWDRSELDPYAFLNFRAEYLSSMTEHNCVVPIRDETRNQGSANRRSFMASRALLSEKWPDSAHHSGDFSNLSAPSPRPRAVSPSSRIDPHVSAHRPQSNAHRATLSRHRDVSPPPAFHELRTSQSTVSQSSTVPYHVLPDSYHARSPAPESSSSRRFSTFKRDSQPFSSPTVPRLGNGHNKTSLGELHRIRRDSDAMNPSPTAVQPTFKAQTSTVEGFSIEIPLVAISAFFGPTSSLPHLERVTATKLKLECDTTCAHLIVVDTLSLPSHRRRDEVLAKLCSSVEDTVRSIQGCEGWRVPDILPNEHEPSSRSPPPDTIDGRYPSPASPLHRSAPEVTRQVLQPTTHRQEQRVYRCIHVDESRERQLDGKKRPTSESTRYANSSSTNSDTRHHRLGRAPSDDTSRRRGTRQPSATSLANRAEPEERRGRSFTEVNSTRSMTTDDKVTNWLTRQLITDPPDQARLSRSPSPPRRSRAFSGHVAHRDRRMSPALRDDQYRAPRPRSAWDHSRDRSLSPRRRRRRSPEPSPDHPSTSRLDPFLPRDSRSPAFDHERRTRPPIHLTITDEERLALRRRRDEETLFRRKLDGVGEWRYAGPTEFKARYRWARGGDWTKL